MISPAMKLPTTKLGTKFQAAAFPGTAITWPGMKGSMKIVCCGKRTDRIGILSRLVSSGFVVSAMRLELHSSAAALTIITLLFIPVPFVCPWSTLWIRHPQGRLEPALEIRIAQLDARLIQKLVVLEALGFLHEAHDAGTQHALRLLHGDERRLGHAGEFSELEQVVGDGGRLPVAHVVQRTTLRVFHHCVADADQVVDVDAVGEAALLGAHRGHAGLEALREQATGAVDGRHAQHQPIYAVIAAPVAHRIFGGDAPLRAVSGRPERFALVYPASLAIAVHAGGAEIQEACRQPSELKVIQQAFDADVVLAHIHRRREVEDPRTARGQARQVAGVEIGADGTDAGGMERAHAGVGTDHAAHLAALGAVYGSEAA